MSDNTQDTKNEIIINVAAKAGVDNTTLAFLVADFLSHTGFDVSFNTTNPINEDAFMMGFEDRLEDIAANTKIVVNEIQLPRTEIIDLSNLPNVDDSND